MYLKAGQAATDLVRATDVVLVVIPGTTNLTPTRAGQLYRGNQLRYQVIEVLMTLGNSRNVAAKLVQNILQASSQMQREVGDRLLETEIQLEDLKAQIAGLSGSNVSRAKPFLEHAGSGLYDIRNKVKAGQELSRAEVDDVVKAAYAALRREEGITPPTKEQIRDYLRGGEADVQTLHRFAAATRSPVFGKLIEYAEQRAALDYHVQQLNEEQQQIVLGQQALKNGNGQTQTTNPEGLEALVQAVSAIKSGNVNGAASLKEGAASGSGINFYYLTNGMIRMLVGAELGKQFLCPIDEVVDTSANKGMLSPFNFNAANGTNVPDEFKQNYLPTQELILRTRALYEGLAKILLAYISTVKRPDDDSFELLRAVTRSLMPSNLAIQTIYPEDKSEAQGSNGSTTAIADRAFESFKSGEMAKVAAKQLGINEFELTQKGLEELVLILSSAMPIVPIEFYQLQPGYSRLSWLEKELERVDGRLEYMRTARVSHEHIRHYNQELAQLQESHKWLMRRYESESSKNAALIRNLQGQFGVDIPNMPQFMTRLDAAIKLFGKERVGFVRQVLKEELQQNGHEQNEQREQQPSTV